MTDIISLEQLDGGGVVLFCDGKYTKFFVKSGNAPLLRELLSKNFENKTITMIITEKSEDTSEINSEVSKK